MISILVAIVVRESAMLAAALLVVGVCVGLSESEDWLRRLHNTVNTPEPGDAPPYMGSLADYTSYLHDITNRLPKASRNYLTVAGVVNGVIKALDNRPWSDYDMVYTNDVPNLFRSSQGNPKGVADEVDCIITADKSKISDLLDIIHNRSVGLFCETKPLLCDNLIQTIIDVHDIPGNDLPYEGSLLLALGKWSNQYFMIPIQSIENLDPWELYVFVVKSKDQLKPLINAGRNVRNLSLNRKCENLSIKHADLWNKIKDRSPI